MTLIILITLLIPAGKDQRWKEKIKWYIKVTSLKQSSPAAPILGTLMKAFIHLSLQVANQPGGLSDLLTSGTLIKMFLSSIRKSTRRTVDVDLATPRRVLYTPFPVCFNSSTHTDTHALVSSNILYYFLFPFADERLWRLILCRLEHFHLGFFLLGSINNVWFTYKVLNDMFDIILAVQHHPEHGQEADIVNAVAAVAVATNNNARFERFTRSAGKIIKGFLLTYCCSLVVLFWIHFNLFAFHIDTHPNDAEEQTYNSRQFVAELPLWTFRWVTLGVAVGDFASRGIYNWLAQLTNCIDDEEVVSLPENKE